MPLQTLPVCFLASLPLHFPFDFSDCVILNFLNVASVFGEQWRLEPMPAERKARWRREIDWLLSVTDHIVEFVPSQQKNKDGSNMEVMVHFPVMYVFVVESFYIIC